MKLRLFKYFLLTGLLVGAIACQHEPGVEEYELPAPRLIVSNPVPCIDEEVTLYYQSDISASPAWLLDGKEISTDAVLKHTFTAEGKYLVSLQLTDGKGGKVTVNQEIECIGRSLSHTMRDLSATPAKILFCSHRANTYDGVKVSNIPENSVEAIAKAIEKGTDMVEIDVRTTYDGYFVLMHDETVNRTTNGSGYVQYKTLAEIKSLKMKSSNKMLTDCTVPTLAEALLAARGKVFVNLDIEGKPNDLRKMVALADSLHVLDRVCFYVGSNKESAAEILQANSKAIVFPWASNNADVNFYAGKTNLVQLNYAAASAASLISYARTKQLVSFSNALDDIDAAVLNNNFTEIDKMKSVQLQIIQTDYVELIKDYINK